MWVAAVTPTPTSDQPFDPNDVTPGPIGFFATVFLFLAVGLIAMSLMRRSARVQARWAVREELEREEAARESRVDAGTGSDDEPAGSGASVDAPPVDGSGDQSKPGK